MKNTPIDAYLGIIKTEMAVESLETVNRAYIQQIVLRAGGEQNDVDVILNHPSVKEIDDDLFYIKI
ncbi:MAG: hypothetical protein R2728_10995 [Chitinophagales bacterium]